jgi:hypothetical protein
MSPVSTNDRVIKPLDRFEPLEFSGVIEGDVTLTFDISTKPDFSVLLEESDERNWVLVGEMLYARLRSDQDFHITKCTMFDNHNPQQS